MASNSTNKSALWWQQSQDFGYSFSTYSYIHPVICAIGFCGTVTLLTALISQRKATKLSLATHSSFSSLLVADAIFLFIIFTSSIYRLVNDNKNISDVNSFLCFARPILQQTALVSQSYLQCVMSIHRILAISAPLWTRRVLTDQRMIVVLILAILFVATTQIGFVSTVTNFVIINNRTRCTISATAPASVKLRYIPITIECIVPSCVLIVSTILIAIALIRRHQKSMIQSSRDFSDEIRLGIVLIVIDIVYLISSVPVSILSKTMSINYRDYATQQAWIEAMDRRRSVGMLRAMASATDWIILICLGNQVRHVFFEILFCRKCRKTEEKQLAESTGQST